MEPTNSITSTDNRDSPALLQENLQPLTRETDTLDILEYSPFSQAIGHRV